MCNGKYFSLAMAGKFAFEIGKRDMSANFEAVFSTISGTLVWNDRPILNMQNNRIFVGEDFIIRLYLYYQEDNYTLKCSPRQGNASKS